MNDASSRPQGRSSRSLSLWSTGSFLAGILTVFLLARQLPPAPPYTPDRGRATYWQSYETSYFASLRTYEQLIEETLADGLIPVVVFGDSSIRGTGATGADIWTRVLEKRLHAVNSRVRVLNFAQNAGDLMGPFLYHHLQAKYPEARYILQWHFASEVGVRHQFHYWLTSEITLRDGEQNPAVKRSFATVPITRADEKASFILAGTNVLTHYLDAGNWVRYRWLGRLYHASDRTVAVEALRDAPESDLPAHRFVPLIDAKASENMHGYFLLHLERRGKYLQLPLAERRAYFDEMFPAGVRSHLLLLTLDFNPFYAPHQDPERMQAWRECWARLRHDMAEISDLNWLSLTGSADELLTDDYVDLGHFTVAGQAVIAHAVADRLLGPGGWFDADNPNAEKLPDPLRGNWYETAGLKKHQLGAFAFMTPRPVRFFSSFGPGLDTDFYNAHPETRLRFAVSSGINQVDTSLRINPAAYENLPEDQATDGVTLEVAVVDSLGSRTIAFQRHFDPHSDATVRSVQPITVKVEVPPHGEIEIYVGAGPNGRDTRDWANLGPVTIHSTR